MYIGGYELSGCWFVSVVIFTNVIIIARKPPVEAALAALVVTYLQFPIQVCFLCIGQPVTDTTSVTVTDTLVVLIIVMIIIINKM